MTKKVLTYNTRTYDVCGAFSPILFIIFYALVTAVYNETSSYAFQVFKHVVAIDSDILYFDHYSTFINQRVYTFDEHFTS